MQPQKTLTGKQLTSQHGILQCSYVMCVMSLLQHPPTQPHLTDVHPPSYSRYMSPLMDIKCFLFAALFWTYIRDRKPISQPINRAHTHISSFVHTHTHTHTGEHTLHSSHSVFLVTAVCLRLQDELNNLTVNEIKEGGPGSVCGLRVCHEAT